MSTIRVPLYQVIFDEDGFHYIYKFNCLENRHTKIERAKYKKYEEAKAVVDELNSLSENEPILMDLEID